MLIDSHCHLDVDAFDDDRDEVLARCMAAGISSIIVPGIRLPNFAAQRAVCDQSVLLHAVYGLHPVYLDTHQPNDVPALADWLQRERPLAVGEIGLDYFLTTLDRQRQQALFEAQLSLAKDFNLPVILHVRRAHDAALATLRRFRLPRGGICHAFAGSLEQARQYQQLGFLLGFGGAATWARAHRLRATLKALPLEALALETDAPDMPPAFLERGARNSPDFLPRVANILAGVREMEPAELILATTNNVSGILQII